MVCTYYKIVNHIYIIYIILLLGLNSCGMDCDFLIGQGYDGAANMAGR